MNCFIHEFHILLLIMCINHKLSHWHGKVSTKSSLGQPSHQLLISCTHYVPHCVNMTILLWVYLILSYLWSLQMLKLI